MIKTKKSIYQGYYLRIFQFHIGISFQLVQDLEIDPSYKAKMYFGEDQQQLYLNFFDFDCRNSSYNMECTKNSRTGINYKEFPIIIFENSNYRPINFEELIGKKLEVDIEPEIIQNEPWHYVYLE